MKDKLISVLIYLFVGILSVLFFCCSMIIWITTIPFDRRLVILHYFSSIWASCCLMIVPCWQIKIIGRDKIQRTNCYIMVSNHASQLDIPVAYQLFKPFKWISKAEVFQIPFIGWNMSLNRYIKLKRGDRAGIKHMLLSCEDNLKKGSSVFIFPEGTRSTNGAIGKFSNGAFALAKKLNTPIMPIVIKGSHKALPKHSLVIKGNHSITLEVLDPVMPESFADKSPKQIADEVRKMIENQLGSAVS